MVYVNVFLIIIFVFTVIPVGVSAFAWWMEYLGWDPISKGAQDEVEEAKKQAFNNPKHREYLDDLIGAIKNRNRGFDKQRKSVFEIASIIESKLKIEDRQASGENVISLFADQPDQKRGEKGENNPSKKTR